MKRKRACGSSNYEWLLCETDIPPGERYVPAMRYKLSMLRMFLLQRLLDINHLSNAGESRYFELVKIDPG